MLKIQKQASNFIKYDFSRHIVKLTGSEKPKTYTLSDLHYDLPNAPCQFAVTTPFKLFTRETVDIVRQELQLEEVVKNCYWSSLLSPLQIRGSAYYSTFLSDLWNCKQLSQYISDIIGVNIIPHTLVYNQGHYNVQIPKETNKIDNDEEDEYLFGWHTDSGASLVVIVMLSEIPKGENVKGNSTLYKDGLGNVRELIFTEIGDAYILHGTQIPHAAKPGTSFKRVTGVGAYKIDEPSLNGYDIDLCSIVNDVWASDHKLLSENYYTYRLEDLRNKINKLRYQEIKSDDDYDKNYQALLHLQDHLNLTVDSYSKFTHFKEDERPKPTIPPSGLFV